MSSDSGKLVVFSAPSGSGKTTLVHHLLQQGLPIGFSISATSRLPRGKEKDGVDYFFMSENSFREKIAENAFLEYEEAKLAMLGVDLVGVVEKIDIFSQ